MNIVIKNEHILDAAAMVLSKRPDATLQTIAAAAGVSRTTIFNRFPTRDDLLDALATDALQRIGSVMALVPKEDPGDVATVMAEVTRGLIPLEPRTVFLRTAPGHRSDVDSLWEQAATPLAIYMGTAQAYGLLRGNQPVRWLVSSYIGLLFAAWDEVSNGELGVAQAARLVVDSWLSGVSPIPFLDQ
jgi:AcrR family transcriptional regulator